MTKINARTPQARSGQVRCRVRSLALAIVLSLGALSSDAQECSPKQYMDELEPGRLALIVGNHDYTHQTKLPSSATDAKRVRDRLIELDFKVDSVPDIKTKPDFLKAISDFRKKIEKGDLVVFYFSGHGFSSGADSFLAPTTLPTSIPKGEEVVDVAMPVDSVRSMLEKYEPGLIIMILDACKSLTKLSTPPDASVGNGTSATVSATPQNIIVDGLTQPRGGSRSINTLIAFSTFPGAVSIGSSDPNAMSLYTRWLVEFITREGEQLTTVLMTAGAKVSNSDRAQSPAFFALSYTDPFLKPTVKNRSEEKKAWCSALKTGDAEMISLFTKLHSVTRHTAAARRWLLDPPKPEASDSTPVSAFAVERAWTGNLRAVRRLEISSFAFPRLMQVGEEGEMVSAADKEVGLVKSRVTKRELANEKTGEQYLKNLGIEANTKDLQKLAFTIASMDVHEDVVAMRSLIARARPNDNELASEIQKGTKLQVSGLARGPNDSVWMKVLTANSTAPRYVKVDPSFAKSRSIVELGQSLKELIVTAVPGSLPDLIDEKVLTDAVTELKNQGWEISWVSLTNGAIDDETQQAIRDAQLAHAQFVLSKMGITREKMTALAAVKGFRKDGVRIRFFGFQK